MWSEVKQEQKPCEDTYGNMVFGWHLANFFGNFFFFLIRILENNV